MKTEEIVHAIKRKFPGINISLSEKNPESFEIEPGNLRHAARMLKEDTQLDFDFLVCCFAVDYLTYLELIYVFHSYEKNHCVSLRTKIDRKKPVISSICDLYPGANWHEREIYDLFGVTFTNHPDLRRILLPEDWEGYPMLKDYSHENLIRRPEN